MQEHQIINSKILKLLLYFLAAMSLIYLSVAEYDFEFKSAIFLPICYIICLTGFYRSRYTYGLGSMLLIILYCFRMCILPVLCAFGNFYLEPRRDIYIEHFGEAILIMCFENTVVFLTLYFASNYASRIRRTTDRSYNGHNFIFSCFIAGVVLFSVIIVLMRPSLSKYYHFILDEMHSEDIVQDVLDMQAIGAPFYLLTLMSILGRPLISFFLVDYFLKKKTRISFFGALAVGLGNLLIYSDRRIYSLLIGACCIFQVIIVNRSKLLKKFMYIVLTCGSLLTIFFCFYGEDTPIRIARKFQRYFSGPTLTAIGISVDKLYPQNFFDFLNLLFNDSILLTGLFGNRPTNNYVIDLCGFDAGNGIWTPMAIGSIQYFGVFWILVLILITCFVIYCDYNARNTNSITVQMIYRYLALCISVYMVMYTVELIVYNIIAIGGAYILLIKLNRKFRI